MIHTNYVHSNDDQGKIYQNYKFHDPWGRGSYAGTWPYKTYNENELFLKKSSSLVLDQTKYIVMVTNGESTEIVVS